MFSCGAVRFGAAFDRTASHIPVKIFACRFACRPSWEPRELHKSLEYVGLCAVATGIGDGRSIYVPETACFMLFVSICS